uniref:hypothetical protein n=1 Tax=Nocardioides pelophilus TaxID=2172019 RepID=UPI0016043219
PDAPAAEGTSAATSPAASTATSDAITAPEPPGEPDVRAEPGDLEVTFAVRVPRTSTGLDYLVERRTGSDWQSVRPRFSLPTRVGGEPQCATVRLVAANSAGRTPGPGRELCKRSRPQVLDLVPVDAACVYDDRSCTFFQLVLEGFAAEDSVPVECSVDDPEAKYRTAQRTAFTNADGKAAIETYSIDGEHWPGAFQVDDANARFYCRAGGKVWPFDLVALRASVGR